MRRVVREAHLLSVILNIEAGPATVSNFNVEVSSYEGIDVEPAVSLAENQVYKLP
jgi:hypothetical protein